MSKNVVDQPTFQKQVMHNRPNKEGQKMKLQKIVRHDRPDNGPKIGSVITVGVNVRKSPDDFPSHIYLEATVTEARDQGENRVWPEWGRYGTWVKAELGRIPNMWEFLSFADASPVTATG
jgi:hypothetical protein